MDPSRPFVDPDIRRARTLPPETYGDPGAFRDQVERVLATSWQRIGDESLVPVGGSSAPVDLPLGGAAEPVLVTRDVDRRVRALSNVCTHRGHLVGTGPSRAGALRCAYHGRCFDLAGRVVAAPGFEDVPGFPSERDALPEVPLGSFEGQLFASLRPARSFEAWIAAAKGLLAWAPIARMRHDPASRRDHEVDAHWALYVENYLEGFHVPYVHGGLAATLDVDAYETRLVENGVLQVGRAAPGEPAFREGFAPPGERGRVAAWWLWLFPTTMLNVYPWGLSVNVVVPLGPTRTRVVFESYVWDASARGAGAGGDLDRVEAEDEAVVLSVQRGVRSRAYRGGRFSPTHEVGVHRFQRLLAEALSAPPDDASAEGPGAGTDEGRPSRPSPHRSPI